MSDAGQPGAQPSPAAAGSGGRDARRPAVQPSPAAAAWDERTAYDRFAASLVGRWAAFATVAPCATVEPVGEATAAIFPATPTRDLFNNALLGPGAADPAATLVDLRRAYARAGIARFALWLRADDRTALAAAADAGWRIADTTIAMHATLPGPRRGDGEGISEVSETDEICVLNGLDAGLLPAWPKAARAYLARDDGGRPVSCAVATRLGDDCALGFVATLPREQRQGHSGRIVARLLADAAADGCTSATLASTAAAERLYRAAGFRDLGRVLVLQSP